MKHCSSCGRQITGSATVCDECDRWAAESVSQRIPVAITEQVAPSATPASTPTPPVNAGGARRPELLVMLLVVVGGGIITLGLLLFRGAPSAEVAAAHVETVAPKPVSTVSQKWSSENRAEWTGGRRNSAAFDLPAENTVPIWMGHVRPTLVVRCISLNTQVYVVTESALKIEPETEDHTVTFSFDDEPNVTERWPDSAQHDALFAPDGAAFAQRLARARTLRFGYTPHNAMPVVVHFRVSGLGELLAPVAKECGTKQ